MRRMIDMARSTAEKITAMEQSTPTEAADYQWGLRVRLDEKDLEKLDLSDDVQAGDLVNFYASAKVVSVSKQDMNGAQTCCVELQIQSLAVEDSEAEPENKAVKRYGKG